MKEIKYTVTKKSTDTRGYSEKNFCFACGCFQGGKPGGGNGSTTTVDPVFNQDRNDVSKVCSHILKQYTEGNYNDLELSFFGGEPTIKIKEMLHILNFLNLNNVNFKSIAITNGTLLDKRTIEALSCSGLENFQITLDGPKNIHDLRRPLKNGESSWDKIFENINSIMDSNAFCTIRVNVDDQNVQYLEEVYNALPHDFFDKGNNMYIAPIVGVLNGTTKNTLKLRSMNMKDAWNLIKSKNLSINIAPPVYAPCPFHSEKSAYYIDLNGNKYTCGGFVGEVNKIEGSFENSNEVFKKRLDYTPSDKCFGCSFFYVCMGSCKFEKESIGADCQKEYLRTLYDEYFTKYV